MTAEFSGVGLRVHKTEKGTTASFDELQWGELDDHQVLIKNEYSSINYKDALAVTGAGRIMRNYPTVAGIDCAGTIAASRDPNFPVGMRVAVTGAGLGEAMDGGYASYTRVNALNCVALKEACSTKQAMSYGTAGFTAALAVVRMLQNNQEPDMGPIAVTGATGGVGSFAIAILSHLGFEVHAITGKTDQNDYLTELGASQIIDRKSLELGTRPLEKSIFGGAVDNLGGELLSYISRATHDNGNIACIGLAADHKLHTSVMPLILRGVNLLGINSVNVKRPLRVTTWDALTGKFHSPAMQDIANRVVDLSDSLPVFQGYVDGTVSGRTIIKI